MTGDFFEILVDRSGPPEAASDCALRLADMLGELGDIQAAFSRMIVQRDDLTGRSARFLAARAEEIAPLFAEQRWYDEDSQRRLSDGLWLHAAVDFSQTGFAGFTPITLDVRVGAVDPESQWLRAPTWVSINFATGARLLDRAKFADLVSALCAVIAAWQPDRGGIFSSNYRGFTRHRGGAPSFWDGACVAFLSEAQAEHVTPPASAIRERTSGGLILAAVDGPFDAVDADHIIAADALTGALRR